MGKEVEGKTEKRRSGGCGSSSSIWTIFMHADAMDVWLMVLGFLGSVGNGFTGPVVIVVTSKIMNNLGNGTGGAASTSHFTETINKNALSFLYVACGAFVASFLEGYCWTRTSERQAARMRARYLRAVLRQDVEYFDLKVASTSEVITSVSSDSLVIQDVLSEKVPKFIMDAASFVGCYAAGFILLWQLALVALPTTLLLVVPGIIYSRTMMRLARAMRDEYSTAGAIAEQAVSSVRTLYSFVAERRIMAEFSTALEGSFRLGLRMGLTKGVALGSNGITFTIWAFLIWYGSRLVMYHGGQGGTVWAAGSVIIFGSLSLGSGLSNVKYFSEASSAGERIIEVIQRVPKIDSESGEGEILDCVLGEVEFQAVEFAYPSRPEHPVFRDFNLKVPAGQTVALVGESGSGKSTAIALLERFYDPAAGEILLDGMDIRCLQLKWVRSQMGLVSQEPVLFATSIKDNILFGKEDATKEEVVAAAKAANAHTFIAQLPLGYNTQVGEGGIQMSGGQKQRIAIARAVIKSPKILLLDEATSALDSESERIVQEALDKAALGRTTIVIAHRLSTIRNAHIIAVVKGGHIMETGSHDDLINRGDDGLYSTLVRHQKIAGDRDHYHADKVDGAVCPSHLGGSSDSMSHRFSAAVSRSNSAMSSFNAAEVLPKPELPVPSFQRLLMLNAPEWKQAVLGSLSAAVYGAIQPGYSLAMGSMVSVYFLKDHDVIREKTRTYAFLFISLSVLNLLVDVGQHYNFAAMGEYLTKRVREGMLSKILTFEVGWFDQDDNSTGAICSRLAKDASVVRSLVGDRIALVIQTISGVTIACTMGLVIAWRLAVVMIAVQPLIILAFYCRRVLLRSMTEKAIKAQSDSSKLAAEAVSNLRTVTAFSSQDRILCLFDRTQDGPRLENIRQSWFAGLILAASGSLMNCYFALDFWYGGRLVANGDITAEALFQTFMILLRTGRTIADAGSMTTDIAKGADTVGSVFAVLDRCTQIEPEDTEGHRPEKLNGSIDIRGLDFAYPTRPDILVFRGFSLTIEAGKSMALVGQSGSGKSTIVSLIERFYDPVQGSVLIDGRDLRTYHLRSLRQHIALVGQEPTLFSGSVCENIMYGMEGANEAEVEAASRAANAHDFVSNLADGYNTWCGDRGLQLSGGQKQRIAIARAILKNPAILLLDEATSALDSQSEKLVQEALERVMVGRTSIVVAHRLSTIQNCDLIAVLDKGVIVEKGTHAALLAKGASGAYSSLVNLQQGLSPNL